MYAPSVRWLSVLTGLREREAFQAEQARLLLEREVAPLQLKVDEYKRKGEKPAKSC